MSTPQCAGFPGGSVRARVPGRGWLTQADWLETLYCTITADSFTEDMLETLYCTVTSDNFTEDRFEKTLLN